MSRIRSLHPSQWSDEDFVGCSMPARLLLLGLRNEADDHGVFEWRPQSLRMRILPGDQVDIGALLAELLDHHQIARFEAEGQHYGVCVLWDQTPRHPSYRYPEPPADLRRSNGSNRNPHADDGNPHADDGSTHAAGESESESESGGEGERAGARKPGPPPEKLLDEWREEAQRQRAEANQPPADLDRQWQRFRRKHPEEVHTPAGWNGLWLNWADDAHPAAAANGFAEEPPPAPESRSPGPADAWGRDQDWWRKFDPGQRIKVQAWAERGHWRPYWGAPPDSPDCRLDSELVAAAIAERARQLARPTPAEPKPPNGAAVAPSPKRNGHAPPRHHREPQMLMPQPGGRGRGAAVEPAEGDHPASSRRARAAGGG
jgi:hypothetical protein